jgi:hypothetical protein
MKQFLFAALLWLTIFNANAQRLQSPNGNFVMEFALQNDGTPHTA